MPTGAKSYLTYLGGSGDDQGQGIAVLPTTPVRVVVTGSTNSAAATFSLLAAAQATNAGLTDAFVTQLDSSGAISGYNTFLGGTSSDQGLAVAADATGNVYLTGATASATFPRTSGVFQATHGGGLDAFVTKLTTAGAVSWSSFLGGTGEDRALSVAVDSTGASYLAGFTRSSTFPTSNATQTTIHGGGYGFDGFVAKVNAAGTALVYSTFLGGGDLDIAQAITVDSTGAAYITGQTGSGDFPVTSGALQTTKSTGDDAFVTKLSASGSSLIYSTFLGGNGYDYAHGLALGSGNTVAVVGETTSTNLTPPAGTTPVQATPGGGRDIFVTQLNSSGSAALYRTYLGGTYDEYGNGIAVDGAGALYVTGGAWSANYPVTSGALQTTNAGGMDGVISKIVPSSSTLGYSTYFGGGGGSDEGRSVVVQSDGTAYVAGILNSGGLAGAVRTYSGGQDAFALKLTPSGARTYFTYLGGSGDDHGFGIALDAQQNAYVVGRTTSANLPVLNATQSTLGGGSDAFVTKLNSAGSLVDYSTYLGGSADDAGNAIALDSVGNLYLAGATDSGNFLTVNALQGTSGGSTDAFFAKIAELQPPSAPLNLRATSVGQTSVALAWDAATDNLAVTGYRVFQGATLIGSPTTTTFTVSGLTPGATVTFTVRAVDAAGNVSAASAALTVTTLVPTATATPTATTTNTPTNTATNTPTNTATNTPTTTAAPIPSATASTVPSATASTVPSATASSVPSATATPNPYPAPETPTATPIPSETAVPSPTEETDPYPAPLSAVTVEPTPAPLAAPVSGPYRILLPRIYFAAPVPTLSDPEYDPCPAMDTATPLATALPVTTADIVTMAENPAFNTGAGAVFSSYALNCAFAQPAAVLLPTTTGTQAQVLSVEVPTYHFSPATPTVTTASFVLPADVQSLKFSYRVGNPNHGENLQKLVIRAVTSAGPQPLTLTDSSGGYHRYNDGWQYANLDLHLLAGQTVSFEFSGGNPGDTIGDISALQVLRQVPGWTSVNVVNPAAFAAGVAETRRDGYSTDGSYLFIPARTSVESDPIAVPLDVQSLHLDYLIGHPMEGVQTLNGLSNLGVKIEVFDTYRPGFVWKALYQNLDHGWDTGVLSLVSNHPDPAFAYDLRGHTIWLRFTGVGADDVVTRIDNLIFVQDTPGWDVSNLDTAHIVEPVQVPEVTAITIDNPDFTSSPQTFTDSVENSDFSSPAVAFTIPGLAPAYTLSPAERTATTVSFLVPESAQTLRFRYRMGVRDNANATTALKVEAVTDGGIHTPLATLSHTYNDGWQDAHLGLHRLAGQQIIVTFGTESWAAIRDLTVVIEVPGWTMLDRSEASI